MNFLGFGQSAEVDILFDGAENRKSAEIKTEDGKKEKYLLYYDGETVSGKVNVTLKKPGSKLEHQGIKIELIGQIELLYDRGNHHEFTSLQKELARPGDLIQNTSYPFEFANVEKPFEVYVGSNVRLRYFLRATIVRRLSDIVREVDIAVHTLCSYPELNNPIKMEVGIEDCLHIEFEYNKSRYHLNDVIVGKIYFLLVRIKIKHMEIAIIKRESGSGPNTYMENDTIAKYEIMDGAPVKGESIPIRVFLAGYDLTPTMRDINKKFSVKYYLNLVLIDTEDRRYFKQQEITLWRKADKTRRNQSAHHSANNPHVPTHLVGGSESDLSTNRSSSAILGNTTSMSSDRDGPPLGQASAFSYSSNTGTTSSIDTMPGALTSTLGDNVTNLTTDPKMGLFTRESPHQETNPITGNIVNPSKNPTLSSSSSSTLPLTKNNSITSNENAAGQMQRGTADGAASTNTTQSNNDQIIKKEPIQNTVAGGSLFDANPIAVATTPPPLPLDEEFEVDLTQPQEIETNISNVAAKIATSPNKTIKTEPKVPKTAVQNQSELSQNQVVQLKEEEKPISTKTIVNEQQKPIAPTKPKLEPKPIVKSNPVVPLLSPDSPPPSD